MQHSVITESGDQGAAVVGVGAEPDTVVVHVQLRPRRASTRRCLAALAELVGAHPGVSFTLTGLSKDDRVVRVTVGVELGPRAALARRSEEHTSELESSQYLACRLLLEKKERAHVL